MNSMAAFTDAEKKMLDAITEFMLDYNRRVNLTRIVEPDEIFEKHYLDSILPLYLVDVPRGTSIIDVGTGAGFPGIPIKIVRPDIQLTLLDSLKKRITYLELLISKLGLEIETVHGRSEELSHDTLYRETFQCGISRAVANLPSLCEYVLPFVKVGGMFLAMKGERDEVDTARNAIQLLGGQIDEVFPYGLPSGDRRNLVVIRKISHTPAEYPRKRVNITKNPL